MQNEIHTSMSAIDAAEPWTNGDRLLCFFDCEVHGFKLHEMLLIRGERTRLLAQCPKGDRRRGTGRLIQIIDPDLRSEIAAVAYEKYLMMGGSEEFDD